MKEIISGRLFRLIFSLEGAIALPITVALTQLSELLDDTSLAVGSEAYAAALQVYSYAKASGQGAGLDVVVGEMGQRFARKSCKVKSQETAV